MKIFREYISQIEAVARGIETDSIPEINVFAETVLNGEVSHRYRTAVALKARRKNGVFFTNESLARRITYRFISNFDQDSLIIDPACGTGDLLLACANKMPAGTRLKETLGIWGRHLSGFDIFPDFIRATKARLILLAKLKTDTLDSHIDDIDRYFPLIRVQNFLQNPSGIEKASHIIINPPYNKMPLMTHSPWANRTISAASLFMDICTSEASIDTKIRAILPDVLRTGSSYHKWREHIASSAKNMSLGIYGQFDEFTDVDVFLLRYQKAANIKKRLRYDWGHLAQENDTLGSYFDVHVGPVVPHRDPQKGPRLAYLHAKTAIAWREIKRIPERRHFSGTAFTPPFVVVRRTSRPGDKRAIGTIVKGKRKVAIENHLLVLLPQKRTLGECRRILRILKSKGTDGWLNQRIRCRHLTVEAMKELPLGAKIHG